MCGNCGKSGHNRRTCPEARVAPAAIDAETKLIRARTDQVVTPRSVARPIEPELAPREIVVSDATDRAVPLRPRRETDEGADQVVVRRKRVQKIAAAAQHQRVIVGRRVEPDESPLPCVPVDLAAIGGSSFDLKRAWGGGEAATVVPRTGGDAVPATNRDTTSARALNERS